MVFPGRTVEWPWPAHCTRRQTPGTIRVNKYVNKQTNKTTMVGDTDFFLPIYKLLEVAEIYVHTCRIVTYVCLVKFEIEPPWVNLPTGYR